MTVSVFCIQAEIKQTPNHPIKIRHFKMFFWDVVRHVEKLSDLHTEKKSLFLFFARKGSYKLSDMTLRHPKSAKMTPHGLDFA